MYATAFSLGMLHGVEPGHGWPIAAVYALRRRRRWWYGMWAAVVLAAAHLASSFVVVALYALANRRWRLDSVSWMNVVAGGLLLLMAVRQWWAGHGHHHDHADHAHGDDAHHAKPIGSLTGLVGFAFALGFVHEEEFAIIALAVGKANAWLVMGVYALAVGLSLVLLTGAAIATLNRFESRIDRYGEALPKVSAVILAAMGLAYMFRLF